MLAHILSDLFVYWPFGALLALCLATLAAVTADRLLALRRAAGPSATLNDALRPMLAEGDLGWALGLAAANTGAFARVAGRILREGLREPGHAEAAAREAIGLEVPLLERRSGAFGAIASIATLLGLAGGVLGVFSRGFGYPPGSSLAITIAHSLSDSLLFTLAGLIVGALALAARGVVHGLVERRRATLLACARVLLNTLAANRSRMRLGDRRPMLEPRGYRRVDASIGQRASRYRRAARPYKER